jgi:hypothetical protein
MVPQRLAAGDTRMTFGDPEQPTPLELFRSLASSENTSYLLSDELRIVRVNEAWTRFAEHNGGDAMLARWKRGAYVLDAISIVLRDFYRALFTRALAGTVPIHHDYECSSDTVERFFRMTVYPLHSAFLAVTHSLTVERPHDRTECDPSDTYLHDGVLRVCSHCRRVRAKGSLERWDWVPAYVREPPPNLSHGLCAPCSWYYHAPDVRGL